MESLIQNWIQKLFFQWQRKLVALFSAAVIWFFVNHSIISSKTIHSIPVHVINLPTDKTISGLLPNGFLSKRITLTLTGARDVIDEIEPGDLEIILDVSHLPEDGVVQISKKNLVSLNPSVNLSSHVTSLSHSEFVVKMHSILTEKIPVMIQPPTGQPPSGYDFLDIWPLHLFQTVSGPQEEVLDLKNQGLEISFDLNEIHKETLETLQGSGAYDDEISFLVPDSWKKIHLPFSSRSFEPLNDPEARNLQITFLRKQSLAVKERVPLALFYPLKYSETINPELYPLKASPFVTFSHDIPWLNLPLYASGVSKLFLDIVKDHMEIEIIAAPPSEREYLEWGVNFVDQRKLEDTYVAFLLSQVKLPYIAPDKKQEREQNLRQRFRLYIQNLGLHLSSETPLQLQGRLSDDSILIHVPNASLLAPHHAR